MSVEIERKFLVNPEKWKAKGRGTKMIQAYLGLHPTVRIRIAGRKAYLTIKGNVEGISRPEFEYQVPLADAGEMLGLAISQIVEKTRYKIWFDGFCWEVDVFSGRNEGLLMAEIELKSEDEDFKIPDWILAEVTGDPRFYNSYLSAKPFQDWTIEMA
jgi:CYTH domain-containing protein